MAAATTKTELSVNTYEGMFILDSNKFASNPDNATKDVLSIIERSKGTVLASRPWQDGKLAYQIDNHKKGLYFLAYFKSDGNALLEIARLCKLSDLIVRHLVLKVDPVLVQPLLDLANAGGGSLSNFSEAEGDSPEGDGRDRDRGGRGDRGGYR